jgi:hypothetical protein
MRLLLLLCAALSVALAAAVPARTAPACGSMSYAYAGVQTHRPVYGVSAAITALQAPNVRDGHVAGWVGVASESGWGWIQIGLSALPGTRTNAVYLEYAAPGRDPQYTVLRAAVAVGERHRFAVSEVAGRPGWWQASLDGAAVNRPVFLPGSDGRWRAQVVGESWNDNSGACNRYSYAFAGVVLAPAPNLQWGRLGGFEFFEDAGYGLVWRSRSHFIASTLVGH